MTQWLFQVPGPGTASTFKYLLREHGCRKSHDILFNCTVPYETAYVNKIMLLRLSTVLIILIVSFASNAEAQSGCYFPNGTEIIDQGYKRCRLDTADSMCCNIGQGVPDQCLPNGLCRNRCDINGTGCSGNSPTYWRETCTDSTWSSPYCLKNACTNSSVRLNAYLLP
jgi:hypothetical protein